MDEYDNTELNDFCNIIFEVAKRNPNEFRNYYNYIKKINELNIPDTAIVPLTDYFIKNVCLEKFNDDVYHDLTQYIIDNLRGCSFDIDRDLFIKDGKFSNKFNFDSCYIPRGTLSEIGKKAMEISYGDMCLQDFPSTDIIVREFITTSYERPSIYFGMKLNTEFRVFYDFNNNSIMGIVNYWDHDTMVNNLSDRKIMTEDGEKTVFDRSTFIEVSSEIQDDFNIHKVELYELVRKVFPSIGLTGEYSADFLWDGERFRLIDMAVANQSYYYDKVFKK